MGFWKAQRLAEEQKAAMEKRFNEEVTRIRLGPPAEVWTPTSQPLEPSAADCLKMGTLCKRRPRRNPPQLQEVEAPSPNPPALVDEVEVEEPQEDRGFMSPGPLFTRTGKAPRPGSRRASREGSSGSAQPQVVPLPDLVPSSRPSAIPKNQRPVPTREARRRPNDIMCTVNWEVTVEEVGHQPRRQDPVVRTRAQHNLRGINVEKEKPRPISPHAPSNAPRALPPVERLPCASQSSTTRHGNGLMKAQLEDKQADILIQQAAEREERHRQRRKRKAETQERCRISRERQAAEARKREEALQAKLFSSDNAKGDQHKSSRLPPLPSINTQRRRPQENNFWMSVGIDLVYRQ